MYYINTCIFVFKSEQSSYLFSLKSSRPCRDLNPGPPWYQADFLPIELSWLGYWRQIWISGIPHILKPFQNRSFNSSWIIQNLYFQIFCRVQILLPSNGTSKIFFSKFEQNFWRTLKNFKISTRFFKMSSDLITIVKLWAMRWRDWLNIW